MQASNFDCLSGWLMSCIIVFGLMFMILLVCMLQPPFRNVFKSGFDVATPALLHDQHSNDVFDAGAEVPEVQPLIDERVFEQVTDVVCSVQATSPPLSNGGGDVEGDGDGRGVGKLGDPNPARARAHMRWNIEYQLTDLKTYAAQLRNFRVEIGLIHKTKDSILRVSNLGKKNRVKHTTRLDESKSAFFASANSRMKKWDQALAKSAIVESGEKAADFIVVHFLDDSMLLRFSAAEAAALPAGKSFSDIDKTHFKIIPVSKSEFQIEVIKMDFK
ncbi:MAG: hypothetical protein AB8B55_09820 [Mariniblastus sp.]